MVVGASSLDSFASLPSLTLGRSVDSLDRALVFDSARLRLSSPFGLRSTLASLGLAHTAFGCSSCRCCYAVCIIQQHWPAQLLLDDHAFGVDATASVPIICLFAPAHWMSLRSCETPKGVCKLPLALSYSLTLDVLLLGCGSTLHDSLSVTTSADH